jgi:hypothetical protein
VRQSSVTPRCHPQSARAGMSAPMPATASVFSPRSASIVIDWRGRGSFGCAARRDRTSRRHSKARTGEIALAPVLLPFPWWASLRRCPPQSGSYRYSVGCRQIALLYSPAHRAAPRWERPPANRKDAYTATCFRNMGKPPDEVESPAAQGNFAEVTGRSISDARTNDRTRLRR